MLVKLKKYLFEYLIKIYMYTYKRKEFHRILVGKFVPYSIGVAFIARKHANTFGFQMKDKNCKKNIPNLSVVHFMPSSMKDIKNFYLGSYKDIQSKREIFISQYGEDYCEFIAPKGDRALFFFLKYNLNYLKKISPNTVLYLDMPGSYYRSIKYLNKVIPNPIVVFRSHNAEAYHNIEKFKASYQIKWLFRAIKTYYYDRKLLSYVDFVDIISKYDMVNYWEPFTPNKFLFKLRFLPFCYPPETKDIYFKNYDYRTEFCSNAKTISFGSVGKKTNILNIVPKSRKSLSSQLFNHFGINKVLVTGNGDEIDSNKDPLYKPIGYIDDPNKLLASSDILLDLSSLGFGFKTKYLDAALSGCKILIDHKFQIRIPLELYPFLIVRLKDGSLRELSSVSREMLRKHAETLNNNYVLVTDRLLNDLKYI